MNMGKKILVCEYHQESNTFNPVVSLLEKFSPGLGYEGEKVFNARMSVRSNVRGAVDAITAAGGEAIPTVFLTAGSGGRMADDILHLACERMQYYIETVGDFDGIYVDLHGATCTETVDDASGEFLRFIRKLIGDKPMTASCDLHANITKLMLEMSDGLCGYQTYPHVDYYETGYRAADLLMKRLAGEKFVTATVSVPVLLPPSGYTTREEPFSSIISRGREMVEEGKLLDFTVFAVQPWLDIPEISSTAMTVAKDPQVAKACAGELAQMLFDAREASQPELLSVDAIIDIAENNKEDKPVIVCDSADSPNGGAVGDSPVVGMRLLERGSKLRAAMFIKDPAGVARAFALGVGGEGEFSVGAGYTIGMPGPLEATGKVRSLHDGYFYQEGPANRGALGHIGKAAVVSFGKLDVLLCENPCKSGDPQLFRHFGIEPTLYDLIVVKANTSFRVPYSKISDLIYVADTPGAGASNMRQFQWENLPVGMYPLDLPEDYKLPEAKIW